jgi:hypothetical protein
MAEADPVLLDLDQPRLLGRREVLQRSVHARQQRTRTKGVGERIPVVERRDQQQRLRQRRQLTRSCAKLRSERVVSGAQSRMTDPPPCCRQAIGSSTSASGLPAA